MYSCNSTIKESLAGKAGFGELHHHKSFNKIPKLIKKGKLLIKYLLKD